MPCLPDRRAGRPHSHTWSDAVKHSERMPLTTRFLLPAGDYTIRIGGPGEAPERREAVVVEDTLTVVNVDAP